MTTRADVVTQAREWIGTPFQHQQRTKGVAVDCAGLVIGVCRALGLVAPAFDVGGYARQPDGVSLIKTCNEYMTPVREDDMQPGDAVVVAYDKAPGHMGILGDYRHGGLSIIHAAMKPPRVIETRLLFTKQMRFIAAYRLPGIN